MKGILTQIPPDDNYHAEEDILHFMNISFDKIKQTHSYGKPFDAEWPAQDHIQEIVNKSSGQFIYASVVPHPLFDPSENPSIWLIITRGLHTSGGVGQSGWP